MRKITVILSWDGQEYLGETHAYLTWKEGELMFYLDHPEYGRYRCLVDKNNNVLARKRPSKRGPLFKIGHFKERRRQNEAFITEFEKILGKRRWRSTPKPATPNLNRV